MKPKLLVLDDWENGIAASCCWSETKQRVYVQFLNEAIDSAPDSLLTNVDFLTAIRERTPITEGVLERLPKLKLILQTGGHADHIDQVAAHKRGLVITLGRRANA